MFLTTKKAEGFGDRSPLGSFWFEPVGMGTASGALVTADNAMKLSAVFACVRIISSQFASLPFSLYRENPDGGKTKVTDHPLYRVLAKRPNQYQNAFEWREMMAGHLALRGNAYNQIVSNGKGDITALIPLHPDRVKVQMLQSGDYNYLYTDQFGHQTTYPRGEIWHLRGLSTSGVVGLSPISLARESFGEALSAQEYGARFFRNDARPLSGWVEYPGNFKDKQSRDQFRESLQEAQSGINRGRLAVFEYGMKYHEIGLSNSDAQFLESRKFHINDIARWFGVPPHKIGDLDRATNNNIEKQALEFIQETLGPMAVRWEASIEAELLFDDDALKAAFDFHQLLRGDSAARSAYYTSGINSGWMTRNQARIMEGMNPLPGLDAPLIPLNMTEEGKQPSLPDPKNDPEDNPDDQKSKSRLFALVRGNVERLARRFAKSGVTQEDAPLIAESLAIPEENAAAWIHASDFTEPTLSESLMHLGGITKGTNP